MEQSKIYVRPITALKMLNRKHMTILEALERNNHLTRVTGLRKINDNWVDWCYEKADIEHLVGLDLSALVGFKGIEEFGAETEKLDERRAKFILKQ